MLFCLRKGRRPFDPQTVKRVVIPKSLRNEAFALCHDGFGGVHLGEKKTWSKIAAKFYWPSAYGDTLNWVQSCKNCAARKTQNSTKTELLLITEFDRPFDIVGMGIIGPLPETNDGNLYILAFSDYTTKWPERLPLKDAKAETVA